MTPFGFIDDGNKDNYEVDSEGNVWFSVDDDNSPNYGFL